MESVWLEETELTELVDEKLELELDDTLLDDTEEDEDEDEDEVELEDDEDVVVVFEVAR